MTHFIISDNIDFDDQIEVAMDDDNYDPLLTAGEQSGYWPVISELRFE